MIAAGAEHAMVVPVIAGLLAMVAVAWIGAWLQHPRRHTQRLELEPRAVRDPRSHVQPRSSVYDWARHDCWPAR